MSKTKVPALGAEGWFTEEDGPALLGNRCSACGTVFFPKATYSCRNPRCAGDEFEEVRLSTRGTVWSYTDNRYQPPPPYVPTSDPFEPFAIAAVELADEGLVVLGQVADGIGTADLHVGQAVELTAGTLFEDDEHEYRIWRWRPVDGV
ncbi:MAG: Zn-ribbon domain-containing OB-fold protein [Acidimicrobiales bacterium]